MDRVVGVESLHLPGDLRHELGVQGIEHLRPVEPDDADGSVGLGQNEGVLRHRFRAPHSL